MTVYELDRMLKETAMTHFKMLSWNFYGRHGDNHKRHKIHGIPLDKYLNFKTPKHET
jgi:hypothetical protein